MQEKERDWPKQDMTIYIVYFKHISLVNIYSLGFNHLRSDI